MSLAGVLSSGWLVGTVAVVSSLLLFSLSVADGRQSPVRPSVRALVYIVLLLLALVITVRFNHLIHR